MNSWKDDEQPSIDRQERTYTIFIQNQNCIAEFDLGFGLTHPPTDRWCQLEEAFFFCFVHSSAALLSWSRTYYIFFTIPWLLLVVVNWWCTHGMRPWVSENRDIILVDFFTGLAYPLASSAWFCPCTCMFNWGYSEITQANACMVVLCFLPSAEAWSSVLPWGLWPEIVTRLERQAASNHISDACCGSLLIEW